MMNETWPVIWNHYFLSGKYFTMLHFFSAGIHSGVTAKQPDMATRQEKQKTKKPKNKLIGMN